MALTTHGLDTHLNELTSCLSASCVWFMHVHCTRSHTGQRRTGSVHLADQAQRDCGQSKQTSSLQISASSLPAGELKTAVRWTVASTRIQLWRGRGRHQGTVARNKKDSILIGRQRWRYRDRRESLRSLCKSNGTIGFNENSCENDDDCGQWIRFSCPCLS